MIEVEGLRVWLDDRIVVDHASFTVEPGSIVVLSGPNGGGKTTILRVLMGIIPNYLPGRVEGRILVDGVDPLRDPRAIRRILQGTQQDPVAQVVGPTVFAEAALTPSLWGLSRGEVLQRAQRALMLLGIARLAGRPVHRLSTGELVKTALAGVLSGEPRYLLLDEPSSHLDPPSARSLQLILEELRRRGLGLLVASHDKRIHEMADKCYTVRVSLTEGCARGPPLPMKPPPAKRGGGAVVRVEGVWARYPGSSRWALRGASLEAGRGEIAALLGPNGSGKTTILLVLAGILSPSRGRVVVGEKPALLPPDPLLLFSRGTLRDEAQALGGDPPGWAEKIIDKPILKASGGEQRLAALALVALSGRRLLLLDEPTVGLDPWNRRVIAEAILSLRSEDYTIVMATHDEELAGLADKIYTVREGRVSQA